MTGQDFERSMVRAFNEHGHNYKINLVAYRHLQMRYQPQLFDVLVDSNHNEFYMALECKSIDASKDKAVYFTQHFNHAKGVHQIDRESNWNDLAGRHAFLVVELRNYIGRQSACYFIPWRFVVYPYRDGYSGLPVSTIREFPVCDKRSGKYIFDDEFMQEVHSQE